MTVISLLPQLQETNYTNIVSSVKTRPTKRKAKHQVRQSVTGSAQSNWNAQPSVASLLDDGKRERAIRRPPSVRVRILAGARRHFFAHGFRGVTMDDLAAELGMSKKTFYQHFANKSALLAAVLEEKFRSVDADLAFAVADCGKNFSVCLHRLLVAVQRQTQELQPAFVRDVQRSAPELFQRVLERRREIIQRHFGRLLAAGQKAGLIRKDIPLRVAIEILLGTTEAIINPAKVLELELTPGKAFSAVIAVFLDGMITAKGRTRS
jgi:AcrR family transcriptional regulator